MAVYLTNSNHDRKANAKRRIIKRTEKMMCDFCLTHGPTAKYAISTMCIVRIRTLHSNFDSFQYWINDCVVSSSVQRTTKTKQ